YWHVCPGSGLLNNGRLPDHEPDYGYQRVLAVVGTEHLWTDAHPPGDWDRTPLLQRQIDRGLDCCRREHSHNFYGHSVESRNLLSPDEPLHHDSDARPVRRRPRIDGSGLQAILTACEPIDLRQRFRGYCSA